MNEHEFRRAIDIELTKNRAFLAAKVTRADYHRTCHAVSENTVKLEMEQWGRTEDALDWAKHFYRRFCVTQEPGGNAFMNNPMSIESMILDRATKSEIALSN